MPGDDLRLAMEAFIHDTAIAAGIVLTSVGSLRLAALRFSGKSETTVLRGPFEIVSLSGTLSDKGGSHLHMSVSDETGRTIGGHVTEGSIVFTTVEIAIGELTQMQFEREVDTVTNFKELKVRKLPP
ncbi:MAG: DNA-binding protein [Bdellovibrionaceae bacterium]|nr:DNA-binding protein [Pseudobdellovibrionaceae bacterium]